MPLSEEGQRYLLWYYDTAVWKRLAYRGVRTLKSPMDLWNYQEIIVERGIEWVLETGTRHGGSALFFSDLLAAQRAEGCVISIDITHADNAVKANPSIRFLEGSSTSPQIIEQVKSMLARKRAPMFVILDSDHVKRHVLGELEAFVPLMRPGDYLVVEDTCVNGHPVRPEFGAGPWEAVEEYLANHPGMLIHDRAREEKFGFTFAPHGHFIRS